MLDLLPERLPRARSLRPCSPRWVSDARASRCWPAARSRCSIRRSTPPRIAVLTRNGVEVIVPAAQGCCGALAWHVGARRGGASSRAATSPHSRRRGRDRHQRRRLRIGHARIPAVLKARRRGGAPTLGERVVDVSAFSTTSGLSRPTGRTRERPVAYHDACHLAHAQRCVRDPAAAARRRPRGRGCRRTGSCAAARHLQRRAAGDGRRARPPQGRSPCAPPARTGSRAGNIGCLTQIRLHLGELPVRHTIQILDGDYEGVDAR